jgi:hypothetical protein
VKSYRKELWFNFQQRQAFVNITPEVEECLPERINREGMALVKAKQMYFVPKWFDSILRARFSPSIFLGSKSFLGKKWRPMSPDEAFYSGHNGRKSEWVLRGQI